MSNLEYEENERQLKRLNEILSRYMAGRTVLTENVKNLTAAKLSLLECRAMLKKEKEDESG